MDTRIELPLVETESLHPRRSKDLDESPARGAPRAGFRQLSLGERARTIVFGWAAFTLLGSKRRLRHPAQEVYMIETQAPILPPSRTRAAVAAKGGAS